VESSAHHLGGTIGQGSAHYWYHRAGWLTLCRVRDWSPTITAANAESVTAEEIDSPLNVTDIAVSAQDQYSSTQPGSQEVFSVLTVCTGNVCRSPAVELLLGQRLGSSISVRSAGTHALVGHPVAEPMARLLRSSGVEEQAFVARRLTEGLVKGADLVLAVTRAQRSLVVDLWPPAVRRTFTLREFARLLEQVDSSALPDGNPGERLRSAMPHVVATRGLGRTSGEDHDDVIDPYRLSDETYAASFNEIAVAVKVIVGALVPGGA
jgi:low molecular weight protein-tyrosine phosphatase